MRSSRNHSMVAAFAIAAIGLPGAAAEATLRSASSGNNRRPTPPRRDTAQQREIDDWNAEVEARKAAKRDRKRSR